MQQFDQYQLSINSFQKTNDISCYQKRFTDLPMQFQQYQKEMKPSEEEKDTHYQINNTFVLNTENKDSSFINDPYKDDFIIQRSSFVKVDIKYNTPDNLIEMFKQLDGQHVEKIDVLSKYIHDISLNEGCQYISNQTGFTRRCQIYLCQFHNTKYQCLQV